MKGYRNFYRIFIWGDVMLHIKCDSEEYNIKNIEFEDLLEITEWFDEEYMSLDFENLKIRFCESYFCKSEIFVKVQHEGATEAILRGRIDEEPHRELIILCYMVRKDIRGQGVGSFIFNKLLSEAKNMKIKNVKVLVQAGNSEVLEFWDSLGFSFMRQIENYFYCTNKTNKDMIIFQRSMYDNKFV